jgi:Chitobiase/beta-hexosaminidase C-terminal domain/Bacterial Ig-like domain (group 2)
MRILHMPHVCSGLLCSFVILMEGCSNPSSQTLVSLTVTATPSTVSVGGASVLKAVAHLSDGTTQDVTAGTTWTLSDATLATMSNGALSAKAAGTVTVRAAYVEATPAGTSPASAVVSPTNLSALTQVTIAAANSPTADKVPAITWSAPAAIPYGTVLDSRQLNAKANVPGTFAYTPAAGTMLQAKKQTLSAVFTPSNSKTYSAATASVQLTVNQATPKIIWSTPYPIVAGTALSAKQLDAYANVPGNFIYNPAAGAVLNAGTQQLSAVFFPTDATDYSSTTAHASLTITSRSNPPTNPAPPSGPTPSSCGGPTINLNPGMSQSTLQSAISSAPNCSLILFAAGTYNITSQLNIPCNNLQIAGPVASTPTAMLAASYTGSPIFYYGAGCANMGTVEYLHFENTGAVYVGPGNNSNFTFVYNLITNLPSVVGPNGGIFNAFESGVFLDGTISTTTENISIHNNTFGDVNSCSAVFASSLDEGGSCAGVITHTGVTQDLTINSNTFYHVEEGVHLLQVATSAAGQPNSVCVTCRMEYNYVLNYHRIGVEVQVSTPTDSILFEHNSIVDPINSSWGTYATSFACCLSGVIQGTLGFSPSLTFDDNVLVSSLTPGVWPPPFGVEFWGIGSIGQNSLVEGTFSGGYVWGYGAGSWAIDNNYICGPNMANGDAQAPPNSYIQNEEGTQNPPSQSGNVTSASCAAKPSAAPTISPAGGTSSGPQTVTLSTSGANTGIWYTTDGSTPVPGSGTAKLYSAPLTLSGATTVRAVGMWGAANQPVTYPSGYGYVPSSVVTASFVAGGVVKRPGAQISSFDNISGTQTEQLTPVSGSGQENPTLASVTIVPSAPALTIGGTTQLNAVATFSDGSTKDVTTDFAWKSSDTRTITVSSSGLLSGLADGQAQLSGAYQGQQASVLASSTVGELNWSGPKIITEGGTYSGNWQSTDARTPAVTVATTAPVIIENSHIRSVGGLIKTSVAGSNLTVRNSLGMALNAAAKGQPNGIFLEVASPVRLDVENNYIENAQGGVIVHGYTGNRDGEQTIVIRSNRARNLNGLLSDGNGGYLPGEGTNRSQARFIQFDSVQAVPGIDVGWNEVINYPGRSLVEDNIDVYRSGGTANQPLEIHDTYIQGGYPYKAAQDAYTGGGIKTDARPGDSAQEVPAFNNIHDNQVVGTVNYGIQFAAGHDNVAANNRVISSGLLTDGTRIAAQHVGMANADAAGAAVSGSMYNNAMHDNLIGWTCWQASCAPEGYRKDQYFPASPADYSTNSVLAARQITLEMENNEYQVWVNKMATAGIAVGPSF